MARRQMAALAMAIGLTTAAGSTALARTVHLGPSASAATHDVLAAAVPAGTATDLAARSRQLDGIARELDAAARRQPPRLPRVPQFHDVAAPVVIAPSASPAAATYAATRTPVRASAPVVHTSAAPVTHTTSSATHGGDDDGAEQESEGGSDD